MANTTFAGTVRAESGLKVSTKAAATGAYTDYFTVSSAGVVPPVIKGCLIPLNNEVPLAFPFTFVTPLEKCVVI